MRLGGDLVGGLALGEDQQVLGHAAKRMPSAHSGTPEDERSGRRAGALSRTRATARPLAEPAGEDLATGADGEDA